MKKIVSVILVVMLIGIMFTGCSGTKKNRHPQIRKTHRIPDPMQKQIIQKMRLLPQRKR